MNSQITQLESIETGFIFRSIIHIIFIFYLATEKEPQLNCVKVGNKNIKFCPEIALLRGTSTGSFGMVITS